MEKENNTITNCIEASGKHINDIGNEHYCIASEKGKEKKDRTKDYFLIQSLFQSSIDVTNKEDESLLDFINQKSFYLGLCLPYNCHNISYQLLENEKSFLDYLFWKVNISNFTINSYFDTYDKFFKCSCIIN